MTFLYIRGLWFSTSWTNWWFIKIWYIYLPLINSCLILIWVHSFLGIMWLLKQVFTSSFTSEQICRERAWFFPFGKNQTPGMRLPGSWRSLPVVKCKTLCHPGEKCLGKTLKWILYSFFTVTPLLSTLLREMTNSPETKLTRTYKDISYQKGQKILKRRYKIRYKI